MNREQAIQNFYSQFLTAYDELSVPDGAVLPYITYPLSVGQIDDIITVNPSIWYEGKSWTNITQKASQIMDGIDGHYINYDDGAILLYAGTPKYQRVDSGADNIRRIVLNIQMEFLER